MTAPGAMLPRMEPTSPPYPYRASAPPDAPTPPRSASDLPLFWTFLLTGLVPVVTAVVRRDTWGAEPSLGLLMVLVFGRLVIRGHRRARA